MFSYCADEKQFKLLDGDKIACLVSESDTHTHTPTRTHTHTHTDELRNTLIFVTVNSDGTVY